MTKKHGPWTIEETTRKYENKWVEVDEDSVITPAGKPGSFTWIKIRPGVSVLALDDDGYVYLAGEFRYAVGRETIEVVSGGIDDEESPLDAAKRELLEELGIQATEWVDLGTVDPFTSMVYSPANLFLAQRLSFTEPQHDPNELINPIKLELREAVRMVIDSRITHGPSCVLILKAYLNLTDHQEGSDKRESNAV
jgi:8-oxo-dGTP pyrophosphatase MutT (NUDIX family)